MAAATPGIISDFYQEKGRRKSSDAYSKKAKQTSRQQKTIPDIYLPLVGQNFIKKYAYLRENLAKYISIPLSLNIQIC